jgi:hypothetical protein
MGLGAIAEAQKNKKEECVVVFVDMRLNKIVDFEIIRKTNGKCYGDYSGSSNGMEVEALRRLILRWKNNANVTGYVHDSDSMASKAIREAEWRIDEFFDPNHISKSFDRKWAKSEHAHLRGLQMKIRKWFNFLIRSDFSAEDKLRFWMNTTQHFLGNHAACPPHKIKSGKKPPLAGNPQGADELHKFLGSTTNMITKCRSRRGSPIKQLPGKSAGADA